MSTTLTIVRSGHRFLWLLGLCAMSLSTGCATMEMTGRTQFILLTPGQEAQLGAEAYKEVLGKSKLSTDQHMTEVVRRVGRRIADSANRPDFQWEFNLIESDQVNAFCLPGGKIAVFTGILPMLANEGGMAAVVGHEVGHAIARHGAERVSQQLAAAGISKVLEIGVRDADPQMQKTVMDAFGVGSKVGILLPYSRTHELEADQIGLVLAAESGYDPREATKLWERMAARGAKKPPEILSTHPTEKRRIQQMQAHMPDALKKYDAAPKKYGLGENWAGE